MIFQRKIDGAMKVLGEKSKNDENEFKEVEIFEKKDKLAIVLAGLLVFSPIFIVLFAILWLCKPF